VRKWFQQRVVLGSILSIMRTCNIRSYTVERCTHQDKLSISIISSREKKIFGRQIWTLAIILTFLKYLFILVGRKIKISG
jgi:hypothetical protein